jgi:hypothetical protein
MHQIILKQKINKPVNIFYDEDIQPFGTAF